MQELIKEFNRENLKPIVFIVIVLFLLAVTAYPQRKFGGKVVEVIDGKTAVIQVPTGTKVTVVLQFIEIPEPDQPLHQTVKEHLEKLVLDKTVEFLPRRMLSSASVGQIFLDGIDVSRQMLRDGAAWYALSEKSAQDFAESELYQKIEAQAKTEKRGVWGVENMKTAWEFRAEKEEVKRREEKTKLEAIAAQKAAAKQQKPQTTVKPPQENTGFGMDMWSNVSNSTRSDNSAATGGLVRITGTRSGNNYVGTVANFLNLTSGDSRVKADSRSVYVYSSKNSLGDGGIFFMGFLFESEKKYHFAESNSLTIIADSQKINLGKGYRFTREMPYTVGELLIYRIDSKALLKIAGAKSVEIKLGKFTGKLDDEYQTRIKNLLAATVN
jgi:endonuclease YncB( thermonuclease family)